MLLSSSFVRSSVPYHAKHLHLERWRGEGTAPHLHGFYHLMACGVEAGSLAAGDDDVTEEEGKIRPKRIRFAGKSPNTRAESDTTRDKTFIKT